MVYIPKVAFRGTRRWENRVHDPEQSMNMANQTPMTIAEKRPTEEGLQEEAQVHAHTQQLTETIVGYCLTVVQAKEWVVVWRRSPLGITTTTTNVDQS